MTSELPLTSSPWNAGNLLIVGNSGTGTLVVTGGGAVFDITGIVGNQGGSTGTVTVAGAGSRWANSGDLFVGTSSAGTLNVLYGGTVSSHSGYIGFNPFSNGTVTVDGTDGANAASTWTASDDFYIGYRGGVGALNVTNGGTIFSSNGFVGYGSTGTVTISGAGSIWSNTGSLDIGTGGTGKLIIKNGGRMTSSDGYVGNGSNGTAMIDGAGSTWSTVNGLSVGASGSGTLSITGGGRVSSSIGSVGDSGSGSVGIDGAGSTWSTGNFLVGNGSLTITNGGKLSSAGDGKIADFFGATATTTIGGAGSTWSTGGNLYVGYLGAGTLNVLSGGLVSSTVGYIGSGGSGAVTIDGAGSTWSNSSSLHIGNGSLAITNGGSVSSVGISEIGYYNGSNGTVTVRGADGSGHASNWTNTGTLYVGVSGTGTLTIANNGSVSAAGAAVGTSGGAGTINIGAATGQTAVAPGWLNVPTVFLDSSGSLVFNHASSNYQFAPTISGAGRLDVENGTTILTANNTFTGGTTINGGTLQLGGGGASGSITGDVTNNGILIFDRSDKGIFGGMISGSGKVNQIGSGTLVLAADNTYAGGTSIASGGTLQVGNGGTSGAIGTGSVANNGTLVFSRSDALTFPGAISGSGKVSQIGSGTLVLAADNTYGGGTVIASGGTLQVGDGGASGAIGTGSVANNGALVFDRSDAFTVPGAISGSGTVSQVGSGVVTLSADNTYTGVTTISSGGLNIAGGGQIAASSGIYVGRDNNSTGTLAVQGTGSIGADLNGTLLYVGYAANSIGAMNVTAGGSIYTGATFFNGSYIGMFAGSTGTVTVDGPGSSWTNIGNLYVGERGTGTLNVSNTGRASTSGSLYVGDIDTSTGTLNVFGGGQVSTDGKLYVANAGGSHGTLKISGGGTVSAANGISVAANGGTGVINIGAASGNGPDAAGILNTPSIDLGSGGKLLVNHTSADYRLASVISGSGNIDIENGLTSLTGNSSGFAGTTSVTGGALRVDGALGNTLGSVSVGAGGTLSGAGTIGGTVTVANGGILQGASTSTLRMANLALAGGSIVNAPLGPASTTALFSVTNDLTLDGSLDVGNAGGFEAGLYRLFNYGGALTNNGMEIGNTPAGYAAADLSVQTSVAKQVNLIVNGGGNGGSGPFVFWDGSTTIADGTVHGGSGTWNAASTNWTNAGATANGIYDPNRMLIFAGAGGGTVTVDAGNAVALPVSAGGLQFAGHGFVVTGDALDLATGQTHIRVGDGTLAGDGMIATIASPLVGAGGIDKTDRGTLVLAGINTYTGGMTIDGGTLALSGNGTLGAATNALAIDGGMLDLGGTTQTIGSLSGTGGVITNSNPSASALKVDQSVDATYAGVIGDGTGAVALTKNGTGALTLTGVNTYSGGTTINGGTLQIGNGGTRGSILGAVSNNGSLTFDRSDAYTFAGTISGSGAINQIGSGATILTGTGSSVGAVTTGGGTLEFGQSGTFTAASYTTGSGAATTIDASAQLAVNGAFTQESGSTLNIAIGSNHSAITADTATLDGTLNVSGYSNAQFTVIRTTGGIAGDFSSVTIGGSSSPVDYLTVTSGKSVDKLDYNIALGLTWNAGPTQGHGTFTLTNGTDLFDVGVALTDQAGTFASRWDGKSLTKRGDGTLTLSAMNTYTGATTINGGMLAITSTGGITSDVINNATFRNAGTVTGNVTNNIGATFTQTRGSVSGDVINNGTVDVDGGTLNGTIINNSGGRFTAGGTVTSDGTFSNANGAILAVAATGGYSLAGPLTNGGVITVDAGGALTASAGILNNASGVITNNGIVADVISNAGLVTNNGTYNANVVSNTGTIDNTAAGIWNGSFNTAGIVNNSGTIVGSLVQTAGTTTNNGSVTGAVTVLGGLFTGAGSAGGLTVGRDATVAPGTGGGIGAMSVAGNVIYNAGSMYQVSVNAAGQGSRINATGAITIHGGTVNVLAGLGNYAPTTAYTILSTTTDGGRTGTFDTVVSNLAFLTPMLSYDASDVYLTMIRNDIRFASIGDTPSQRAVGSGVEALAPGSSLWNAVVQLDEAGARSAFDQLSGEMHASAKTALIEDSRFVRDAALDRLRSGRCGISGGATALATPAANGDRADTGCDDAQTVTWARAFGSWGNTAGDGNAARLTRSTGGVFMGTDGQPFDDWRLGILGGYSHTDVIVKDRNSSGTSDNYTLGLYAGKQWRNIAIRLGTAYTRHDISTSRGIAFAGLSDSLKGRYDAGTTQVFGEFAYVVTAGAITFEPFANLAYVNLQTDGFAEEGGPAALTDKNGNTGTSFTTLGMRGSTSLGLGGLAVKAAGSLGWRHALGDVMPESNLSFAGGSAFTVAGITVAKDAAVIDIGLDLAISKNTVLGVSYGGQFGPGVADNSVRANLHTRF